jgi:hypothetical protein
MIEQRRLTGAVTTHKRNHFTCSELKINPTKRGDGAIGSLKTVRCGDDLAKQSGLATEDLRID